MRLAPFFFVAFVPRAVLASIFSLMGYLGDGGDAEAFHLFGVFLKDLLFHPNEASFDAVMQRWGYDNPEAWDQKYYAPYEVLSEGHFRTWVNTTIAVIALHSLVYSLWESPFLYVLVTSAISALSHATFARAHNLNQSEFRWLAYNPISVFFAATHFKETWTESLLLVLLAALRHKRFALSCIAILGLLVLRITYAPLVIAIIVLLWLRPQDVKVWVVGLFAGALLLPPLWWNVIPVDGTQGPVYSLIHLNDLSRKLLAPIIGFIQPVPFFAERLDTIWGWFLVVYGFFHAYLLFTVVIAATFLKCRERYVTLALVSSLAISYYVLGGASAKARFFAPLIPVLIMAYLSVRPHVRRWAWRRWGALPAHVQPRSSIGL